MAGSEAQAIIEEDLAVGVRSTVVAIGSEAQAIIEEDLSVGVWSAVVGTCNICIWRDFQAIAFLSFRCILTLCVVADICKLTHRTILAL